MDLPELPCKVEPECSSDSKDKGVDDGDGGGTPMTDKALVDPAVDPPTRRRSSGQAVPVVAAAATDDEDSYIMRSSSIVSVQIATATLPEPERSSSLFVSRLPDNRRATKMTLQSGYFGMQGRRPTMEDYHTQLQHPDINRMAAQRDAHEDRVHRSLFAIFDGHGGQWCADYCSKMVQQHLVSHELFRYQNATALSDSIIRTDETFCKLVRNKGFNDSSGSTAIVAYIVEDQLLVANVGDSRAVLCRSGRCVPLSVDHKPNRKDERARITSLGGYVGRSAPKFRAAGPNFWQQFRERFPHVLFSCCTISTPLPPYRVYPGGLAISRSIGDLEMKASRLVINTPEIQQVTLDFNDEFVILGCDGVWDVIGSDEAVRLVRKYRETEGDHPMEAAKHLAMTAFSEGSSDNISVLIIYFRRHEMS